MLRTLRTHSHENKKQTSLCDELEFYPQLAKLLHLVNAWFNRVVSIFISFDNSWLKIEIQNSEKSDFWGFQSQKWGNLKKKKITRFEYVIFIV
jgi:hypothetical protein